MAGDRSHDDQNENDLNDLARRDELRHRAEAALEARRGGEEVPSGEAMPSAESMLVQELRVHQIELEMQNEELRRAQEALLAARDRYLDLYDFAPVGYLTLDASGRIREANLRAATMLGMERANLMGRGFGSFVAHEDQDAFFLHRQRVRRGQERGACELRLRRGETEPFWAQLSCQAVSDGEEHASDCRYALTDVSERRQMEAERLHTQRLRAVGELAAGISHNLNNILTGILMPAQHLQERIRDADLLPEVETLLAAARRATDLVQRLHRSVHRTGDEAVQAVQVAKAVQEVLRAGRPRWQDEAAARGIAIEVETRIEDVAPIRGTASGLHDLLINLLFNAVDALPRGGTITIAAQQQGERVHLTFHDTGIGMDEATRGRVFEPFFTSKREVGSGLGLATAYNTVRQWGGQLEVESSPGAGTTFSAQLPVWKGPLVVEKKEKSEPAATSSQGGRLLVVEDEEIVGAALVRILSEQHEVEHVRSGRQALDRFTPGRYDVAILDLGLPGMPGDEVAKQMRSVDGRIALVLITGWCLDDNDSRLPIFDLQLQKPFDPDAMRQILAQAMALRAGRSGRPS